MWIENIVPVVSIYGFTPQRGIFLQSLFVKFPSLRYFSSPSSQRSNAVPYSQQL